MGPRSLNRGDEIEPTQEAGIEPASMGPRSLNRGDLALRSRKRPRDRASMGPRSLNRGDQEGGPLAPAVVLHASMGPRSLNRGDGAAAMFRRRLIDWLQWGRGLSTAEITGKPFLVSRTFTLQWGRGLSTAEITNGSDDAAADWRRLQWGRGLSTAEMQNSPTSGVLMEMLQWGRGLSTAEIRLCFRSHVGGGVASMGPRSLNRGDLKRVSGSLHRLQRFNGAAVSQPRR